MSKSSMTSDLLPAITPGDLLLEEFLNPMGISQYRLATGAAEPRP